MKTIYIVSVHFSYMSGFGFGVNDAVYRRAFHSLVDAIEWKADEEKVKYEIIHYPASQGFEEDEDTCEIKSIDIDTALL